MSSSAATSTPKPIATSSAATTMLPFAAPQPRRSTRVFYSPVISAMVHDHTMRNCDDIKSMNTECLAAGSDASICKTAAMYMSMCVNGSQHS
ncbi:expressed unknown protein [Seminavis robusta]|uniref:Uncharacterized protein n=1 Tax=Seminavis robusta TaxID=568900 RepID=A0A9N8E0G9_9STRA|nr:expressed unknown protein [Seminavis robusta]|eukprot:Sro526_g160410.1 n/a (92) ;mRNA; f:35244-35519